VSITYSLRRSMDPSFRTDSEQAQMERVLEQAPAPVPDGGLDVKITRFVMPPALRLCRLCGRSGRGGTYCLTCLADSME
jgi:hypothetical protein